MVAAYFLAAFLWPKSCKPKAELWLISLSLKLAPGSDRSVVMPTPVWVFMASDMLSSAPLLYSIALLS